MLRLAKAHLHHRAYFFIQRTFEGGVCIAAKTLSFCLFAQEGYCKNEKIYTYITAISRFVYSFTCNIVLHRNLYLHLIYFLKCLLFGTIFA